MQPLSHRILVHVLNLAAFGLGAPLASAQGGVGTPGTILPVAGISIENGFVSLHFSPSASDPHDLDLSFTDLQTGHSFEHRDWRLWKFDLVEQPLPGPNPTYVDVLPTDSQKPVTYHLAPATDGKLLTLHWLECAVGGLVLDPTETIDVDLQVFLPNGSPDSRWTLGGKPALTQHAFATGRISLSIESDGAGKPSLLTPLGMLTSQPAQVLPTDEAAWIDMQIRPVAQLSSYDDGLGHGLYLATLDGDGDATKNFRYGASPDQGAWRYEAVSYSDDYSDPTRELSGLSLAVGRFQGDWWDAAARYKSWLDASAIAELGQVAARDDVPAELKVYQHVGVLSPMQDYFTPCGGQPPGTTAVADFLKIDNFPELAGAIDFLSVPQRIAEYNAYWGLEHTVVVQFGTSWVRYGDDGVGSYAIAPNWFTSIQAMEALDHFYMLYLFDAAYRTELNNPFDTSYLSEGWADATVLMADGQLQKWTTGSGPTLDEFAMIDPSTAQWQERMIELGVALALEGVDGVYIDNFFPDPTSASFTSDVGHLPGYGDYLTAGFARTLNTLRNAGRSVNPGFTTYTEVSFESYLGDNDAAGPLQASADFVTGDAATRIVPLHALLYHDLAISGPGTAGYYARVPLVIEPGCACPGYDSEGNSVFSCDVLERARARRGALYTLAYSWVNGSPLWSPDLGMTNPKCYVFSYELPDDPCFTDYKAVCEWAARLSRVRGAPQTARFLNVGTRLRDLEWTSVIPTTAVTLTPLLPGQEDTEQVPALVHGLWKGAGDEEIALAVANHSDVVVAAPTFEYDAQDWSDSPGDSYLVLEVVGDLVREVGTISGLKPGKFTLPDQMPETFSFYRIVPAPELRAPLEGGKVFGKK